MSETSTESTTTTDAQAAAADTGVDDGRAEVEKWKALARKHEAEAKAGKAAATRLAAIEESHKTETQKLADRAEQAERERDALRLEATRSRVALTKNLPPALASRLQGTTEEELSADADALLSLLPKPDGRPKGSVDQGARTTPPKNDMNATLRAAFGR